MIKSFLPVFMMTVLLTFAAAFPVPAQDMSAPPPDMPQQTQEEAQASVTVPEDMMQEFVITYRKVTVIRTQFERKINSGNLTEREKDRLTRQEQREMRRIVSDSRLSLEQYNFLVELIRSDPAVLEQYIRIAR